MSASPLGPTVALHNFDQRGVIGGGRLVHDLVRPPLGACLNERGAGEGGGAGLPFPPMRTLSPKRALSFSRAALTASSSWGCSALLAIWDFLYNLMRLH